MGLRAEPGKQKTRSCRTQELARSSARGNEWKKKGWRAGLRKNRREQQLYVGNHGEENGSTDQSSFMSCDHFSGN
jgi:hypothetical protein